MFKRFGSGAAGMRVTPQQSTLPYSMRRSWSGGGVCGTRNGFTMIELIITVVIAAILVAIAIPAFRLPTTSAESKALLGTLQYAQSSAIRLGQLVVVCPSSNPNATSPTCGTSSAWNTGWIVLLPAGETTGCAATGGVTGDQVLRVEQALKSTDTATFAAAAGNTNTSFCFYPQGFSPTSANGTVEFAATPDVAAVRSCTVVAGVGHIQVLQHGQTDFTQTFTCP